VPPAFSEVWRHARRLLGVAISGLLCWAALSNIAPDVFQIKGKPVFVWLSAHGLWILAALAAIWLAAYLWSIDKKLDDVTTKQQNEMSRRQSEYESWLKDRQREISQRSIAEYQGLAKQVEDFTQTGTEAIERLRQQINSRLERLERRAPHVAHVSLLTGFITRGDEMLARAEVLSRGSEAHYVEVQQLQRDVMRWEGEATAWLNSVKPGIGDDLVANFHVPSGSDLSQTLVLRIAVRQERLRAIKVAMTP